MTSVDAARYRANAADGSKRKAKKGNSFGLSLVLFAWSPAWAMMLCLFGFFIFVPLLDRLPGLDGSMPSLIFRFTALLFVIGSFISHFNKRQPILALAAAPLAYCILFCLRYAENVFRQGMLIDPKIEVVIYTMVIGAILPMLMISSVNSKIHDREFGWVVAFLAGMFALMISLETNFNLGALTGRLYLEKANPIALALTASTLAVGLIMLWRTGVVATTAAIIFVPYLITIFFAAQSRGPIVSLAFALAFYAIVMRGWMRIVGVVGMAIALAIGYFLLPTEMLMTMVERFANSDVATDESTYMHYMAYTGSISQFLQDPFFGRFVIELFTGYYPHNLYLEALISVGLFGTIPLVIYLVMTLRAAVNLIRTPQAELWVSLVVILFLRDVVQAAFSGAAFGSTGVWVFGLVILAVNHQQTKGAQIAARKG